MQIWVSPKALKAEVPEDAERLWLFGPPFEVVRFPTAENAEFRPSRSITPVIIKTISKKIFFITTPPP